jgi:hypothetical protein
VVLDVSDVIAQVQRRLVDRGLTIVENVPIPTWTSRSSNTMRLSSSKGPAGNAD